MKILALLARITFLASISATSSAQTTWFVDAAAAPGGNGSSSTPFTTIQAGIDAAASNGGDSVEVWGGVYLERIDFLGKNIVVRRAPGGSQPTIDGSSAGTVVTITAPDWGNSQVLSGFLITGGDAGSGGGLSITNASPWIVSCTFDGNRASVRGAGAYVIGATNALIEDCTFDGNGDLLEFGLDGGGLYAFGGATIRTSTFVNNRSGDGGGAAGGALYQGCVFTNNQASGNGGGVRGIQGEDCVIRFNTAGVPSVGIGGSGGGAYISGLTNCEVSFNDAYGDGGGALSSTLVGCDLIGNDAFGPLGFFDGKGGGSSSSTLTSCVLRSNSAGEGGGTYKGSSTDSLYAENFVGSVGMAAWQTALVRCRVVEHEGSGTVIEDGSVDHCVFYANTISAGFSGSLFETVTVTNSIVRNHSGVLLGPGVNISYSNVEGGVAGTGNIDAPAMFWAPAGGPSGEDRDFHLMAGSPCIDAGDPSSPNDPDGSVADMGAYPFDASWFEAISYCVAGTTSNGCQASMSWSGIPSVSASSGFDLIATSVKGNALGILFFGVNGSNMTPWGAGSSFFCVAPPLRRMQAQNAGGTIGGCDGELREDFNVFMATHPGGLGTPFTAGDTIWAQAWFRDPPSPKTSSLSNGLQFTVGP